MGTPLDHALLDKICLQFPASCPSKGDSGCPHPMALPRGSEEIWFTVPRQRPADTKCSVSQDFISEPSSASSVLFRVGQEEISHLANLESFLP